MASVHLTTQKRCHYSVCLTETTEEALWSAVKRHLENLNKKDIVAETNVKNKQTVISILGKSACCLLQVPNYSYPDLGHLQLHTP